MWDLYVINPMINALLLLYQFLGNNFVLAITVFTIVIRLLTLPLNLRQQRSSMRMQKIQPQIQAIQKKYKDNPQKMQEEFQKIGYNPAESLMGCLPLLIQMPILIGLYRSILFVLGSTPQSLFELTQRVYEGINLTALLPINNRFLWLDLGQPDPWFILPVLVLATMFVQQKFLSPTSQKQPDDKKKAKQDDASATMSQSMQYTMPIMFGFFSLQFQAGLSVYFVLSNLIGIGQGVYVRRAMALAAEEELQPKAAADGSSAAILEDKSAQQLAAMSKSRADERRKQKTKRPPSKRKRQRRSAKR